MNIDEVMAHLKWCVDKIDRESCPHENLSRGGVNWTICNDCGWKWADDRGGFVPYVEPPELARARDLLQEYETALPAPNPFKNGCLEMAVEALRYIEHNTYPHPYGQHKFNAEHLLQIADEIEAGLKSTCVPVDKGLGPQYRSIDDTPSLSKVVVDHFATQEAPVEDVPVIVNNFFEKLRVQEVGFDVCCHMQECADVMDSRTKNGWELVTVTRGDFKNDPVLFWKRSATREKS